jgi:CheY-like chemotaxis protein
MKKRILIIEDDAGVRTMIKRALTFNDYEVLETANGKEGLACYQHSPTDLVITDLIMPEKDGIETIIELGRNFPGVKIIAMTGGSESSLRCAKHLGANRTLAKPFKISDLLEAVRKVLE